MAKIHCCEPNRPNASALYSYYAIMSLLVIVLAITLIWLPFVQLITEFATIISKVIIYFKVNYLGIEDDCVFKSIVSLLQCEKLLKIVSIILMSYLIFLASGDILAFTACLVYNLPNSNGLYILKIPILKIILFLLNLTGQRVMIIEQKKPSRKSCKYTSNDGINQALTAETSLQNS